MGLVVAVAIGSTVAYGSLPDRVPTHWDIRGRVDGHGPRSVAAFLMPGLMVVLLGLFSALPGLSPAQFKLDSFRATYGFVVVVALAMLGFVHVVALKAEEPAPEAAALPVGTAEPEVIKKGKADKEEEK